MALHMHFEAVRRCSFSASVSSSYVRCEFSSYGKLRHTSCSRSAPSVSSDGGGAGESIRVAAS
eukprot:scaffold6145_cov60-Phaeocystis_antarctica.AAC.2